MVERHRSAGLEQVARNERLDAPVGSPGGSSKRYCGPDRYAGTLVTANDLWDGSPPLDMNGPPLGWFLESEYPVTTVELEHGNLIVLLTDGIEEAMNPDGVLFGRNRVSELIRRECNRPLEEIVESIHGAVGEFRQTGDPNDDATVIIARVL